MSKIELRDEIDFNNDSIPKLFRSILIPTLLGMSFTALFIIADGIFVGRGIGGDALAAVNIVAPFYSIAVSVGLMLGMGASILASIHLVNRKRNSEVVRKLSARFSNEYSKPNWIDVHGAGSQRSDPKSDDPSRYANGHGPQGDVIRINNYVRLVRDL